MMTMTMMKYKQSTTFPQWMKGTFVADLLFFYHLIIETYFALLLHLVP